MYFQAIQIVSTAPALPAGARTDTVLAAPGVNFAYRIIGCHFGINRAATGIVDLVLQDGSPLTIAVAMGLSIAGVPNFDVSIPEPGLQCNTNQPLQISLSSSAAAGSYRLVVYYFVDQIT